MRSNNYTLGKGSLYFARFEEGTEETPGRFRFFGNVTELGMTIETEDLEHTSSTSGVREVDDSVALSVTRTGTMVCDAIHRENVALFFFGDTESVAIAAANAAIEDVVNPKQHETIQLGLTAANRVGARGVRVQSITHSDNTVLGADKYRVDQDNGLVTFDTEPPAGTYTVAFLSLIHI